MALYHKWDVKTGFIFARQFFMLISDDLGGVVCLTSKSVSGTTVNKKEMERGAGTYNQNFNMYLTR